MIIYNSIKPARKEEDKKDKRRSRRKDKSLGKRILPNLISTYSGGVFFYGMFFSYI